MHRYFFTTQDTFISSGSDQFTGEDFKDKNVGQDEVLELKKVFFDREFAFNTRILVQFDTDEIKNYITSSNIPSNYKLNLRLYETEGTSGLSQEYSIIANPLSQSWDEGLGKESDEPKTTDGCSWKFAKNKTGATEVPWATQFPEGESVDGAFASASIDLSNFQFNNTSSLLFIKNPNPEFPELDEFTFLNQEIAFSNPNFGKFYAGNGLYMVGGSGSLDFVGSALRDTINLFNIDNGVFSSTKESFNTRTITTRHHTSLQFDGGGILPYSASWDGTNLHLTASRTGIAFNSVIISTGSINAEGNHITSSTTPFGGGFGKIIDGAGGNFISTISATQNFSSESPDINIDITNIAKKWFSGEIENYGLLLRLSGSSDFQKDNPYVNYETYTSSFEDLKFFSRQTNTIYSPKLELKWDDHLPATGSNTGSLTELDISGNSENYLYPIHFKEAYKENETVKFRFGARKRYIQKSFSTSYQTVSGSYIPHTSGAYSIIDMATNESVVPFSAYTTMSCDTTSNYFTQDLNAFEPNRAYKILIKVNHDDGQEIIYDNDFEFILRT